jgi:hypothetical protein
MDKQYISTTFSNLERVNDEFVKCTVSVNSYDQIANGTKFRKEAIEKALPTLNYCPVIGFFDGDFNGHGIEYKITDEGIEEVVKTVPFGVVIKDSYRWEKLMKDNGEYEDYVVVDCYLWGRYKDAIEIVKNNSCNQSMEVNINSAEYTDNYYDITDFTYSALCILGETTTPAFNLAKIRTSDKFSKDSFKECYSEMTEALDKFLNFEQGGDNVKKRTCCKCGSEIEVDYEFDKNEEFTCDKCSASDFSKKEKYELSFDEIREKIRNAIQTEDSYCWIVQTFSNYFIYEEETYKDNTWDFKFYKQSYSLEDDEVKLADDRVEVFTRFLTKEEMDKLEEEKVEYENKILDLKAKFTDLTSELEDLKGDYSILESETEELRKYKSNAEFEQHKVEVDEVLGKYSELEAIDGYSELVKEKYIVDIEELEKAIKVFAFDNGAVLTKKNTKKSFSKENAKISIINKNRDGIKESAWDILDKYVTANK